MYASALTMCCCTWTQDELEDLVGTKLQSLTPKCIDTLRAVHKATGCKCHGDHLYWHTGPGTRHTLEDESGYKDCYKYNDAIAYYAHPVLTFEHLPTAMSLTAAVQCFDLSHLYCAVSDSPGDTHRALNAAAATGFEEAIPFLVSVRGANPHALSGYGEYCTAINHVMHTAVAPLITAVLQSQHGSVKALLRAAPAIDVGLALRVACSRLDLTSIGMLLAAGADPDGDTQTAGTPLQAVLQNPRNVARAVAMLLEAGASPTRTGLTDVVPPMHLVVHTDPAMYRLLVKAGAPVDQTMDRLTPLGTAIASYRLHRLHLTDVHVAALIELGADTTHIPVGVPTRSRLAMLQSNETTTTFQRVMIGTPVPTMKGLLRDGIATTTSTTFADLTRLARAFNTSTDAHAFARLALGPWKPVTHHFSTQRATIALLMHIRCRLDNTLFFPPEMWHHICAFVSV
jgi:hypothetical protein